MLLRKQAPPLAPARPGAPGPAHPARAPCAQPLHGARRRRRVRAPSSILDGDGPATTIAGLRSQLEAALREEDYQAAAQLRDSIQLKMVDSKMAIEDANSSFYAAFRAGDLKAMEGIWGQGEHVQVIHPGGDCIAGRAMVMDSWRSVLANIRPRAFRIDLEDVRISASDNHGYVTCVEVINADDSKGRICATNVFEKQDGRWVVVLHHGSIAPLMRKTKLRARSP